MALAGFGKDDIEIEVAENTLPFCEWKNQMMMSVYRGISFSTFDRKFTLADDILVNGASLENGMLTIELERIIPEEKKPRLIEVK